MKLSFRTKIILGVAAIEAVMLLLLIGVGLGFMRDTSENELKRHADTATTLFAATTRDAVLTDDMATLESATVAAMRTPGILYARVLNHGGRVLTARGAPGVLARSFRADTGLDTVDDGIYDAGADIQIAGVHYGRVELGLSVNDIHEALTRTTRGSLGIAFAEMAMVALFSYLLGSYLTRQLAGLRDAALRLRAGGLGHQVVVHGNDELAETAQAFNHMSAELAHADRELRERERALNEAQSIAHIGHWDWDFASQRQDWSAETRRLFGVPADAEVSFERFLECVHPDDRTRLQQMAEMTRRGVLSDNLEYRVLRPDGTVVDIHYLARLRHDDAGNVVGLHGTVQDVTERKRAEAERTRLSSAIRQVADSIIITDRNGTIEFVNPAFETISGFSAAEAIGHHPNLVKSGTHDKSFYERLWSTILSGEVFRGVLTNRRKDGSLYFEEKSITPIRDEYGQVTHFVSASRDITDRIRAQERLRHLAYHDALTGLQNRPAFSDRLRQAVAQAKRRQQPLTVLFLDLDRFKEINDELGHAVGDGLLQAVGKRLLSGVRVADTVARLGGDEFAVILDGVGRREDVETVAAKLLAAVSAPVVVDGHTLEVTVSLGAAIFPDHAGDDVNLLKMADMAMYQAKRSGRNRLCLYSEADPSPPEPSDRREPG